MEVDQPFDLSGQLGRFQPSEQILPLGGEARDDLADHLPRPFEVLFAVRIGFSLGLDEQLERAFHFLIDESLDVLFHSGNLAIQWQLLHAVLFELLQLDVENAGDKLPRHVTGPFLGVLLATQFAGVDGVGARREQRQEHDGEKKETTDTVRHRPSPMPS